MNNKYAKAYTEVLEILSHFSKEEYERIPIEKINFYKENMDKDYNFKIDPLVELAKQNISREANSILISLFRDYFATEKQKSTLNNLLNQNQVKIEEEKKKRFSSNNIFDVPKIKKAEEEIKVSNTQIVEYKENFFVRFKKFIFRLLHINN